MYDQIQSTPAPSESTARTVALTKRQLQLVLSVHSLDACLMMIWFLLIMMIGMAAALPISAAEDIVIASLEADRPVVAERKFMPISVKETLEFHDISGTSEQELREGLRRQGIHASDGGIYDSATSWEISWNYGYRRSAETCSADTFKVSIDVRIRYPRWARNHDAPQALVEKWDRYFLNLVLHEKGHRDIAVRTADELSKAVAELPAATTCADLDREVIARSEALMKRLYVAERDYDKKTDHGALMGAILR